MATLQVRTHEFFGRGINLAIISIVFVLFAFCLVGSRLASRFAQQRKLGLDDYAIVASIFFSIGLTICNVISVGYGMGKPSATLAPEDLRLALQAFWVSQIVYKFTINLTKTSICLLYLRVFNTADKRLFRRVVYCAMTYVLLYAVASIVATIFQCTPIGRIWNRKLHGTCINLTAFWYANAAANIFGDVMIFLLPMPVIRSLNLPSREKWGLTIVFCTGFFVCITSILRMTTLDTSSKNPDQTFGTLNSTIWTAVEANTGIICACMPMLKKPLTRLFPKIFPYGSYYVRGSTSTTRRPSNSPPTGYQSWTQANVKTQPSVTVLSGTTVKTRSAGGSMDGSNDNAFGIPHQDVPMGHIAKTTQVNVQYVDDRCSPALSPNNKQHARSISNLVGEECSFP